MSLYPATKRQVRTRDRGRCVLCGASERLTAHHIRPRAIGGTSNPRNLVSLCRPCHGATEDTIRDAFTWLASVAVWLVAGPILIAARLLVPLRWRAALKPSGAMESDQ